MAASEGKQPGWWQSYDLGEFSSNVDLEEEATMTKYYQSTVIPGLLQTANYAHAMHEAVRPKLDPERVDELVKVRLSRQELLKRDPPLSVSAILDEAALHRVVGGVATMHGSCDT